MMMKILMLMLMDVENDYENVDVDVGSDAVVWMLLVMLKMMLFRC